MPGGEAGGAVPWRAGCSGLQTWCPCPGHGLAFCEPSGAGQGVDGAAGNGPAQERGGPLLEGLDFDDKFLPLD